MISNKRLNGQNDVDKEENKNEVSAFQRVHVILDDQPQEDRPNYINQNDIGIVSSNTP